MALFFDFRKTNVLEGRETRGANRHARVVFWCAISALASSVAFAIPHNQSEQAYKPFTIADEIGMTLFNRPTGGRAELHFSADGRYVAVKTERGRLDLDKVEDSLRFYRIEDIARFLAQSGAPQPPSPVWVVTVSDTQGSIITDWRWLLDSSGVAFLRRTTSGNKRLVIANLRRKRLEPLTAIGETVAKYDIRDREHYVYTALGHSAEAANMKIDRYAPTTVGTGRSLFELLFPDNSPMLFSRSAGSSKLWNVVSGKRFEVKHDGSPLVPEAGAWPVYLALSPDGNSLITTLLVPSAPSSWETLYPPPFPSSPYHIRSGKPTSQYVLIDLRSGRIQPLTNAPIGYRGGWQWVMDGSPSWASDGQAIILPNTFIESQDHVSSRPCVAVVDLPLKSPTCVETLQGPTETGWEKGSHTIEGARFADGDKHRVLVIVKNRDDSAFRTIEYRRASGGWKVANEFNGTPPESNFAIDVTVKQGLNEPPQLIATNDRTSRIVWNPNSELQARKLGKARVETWSDEQQRDWRGVLYLPSEFDPGHRYPLVIQTHGFEESEFQASGAYPTAFAARELAELGIAVLQVREPCAVATPNEGPCAVSGYKAAIHKFVSEGLVDPDNVGIIGFSRTCFYVMQALTTNQFRIKAASITDGQMVTYSQYLDTVGSVDDSVPRQFAAIIGAQPFGAGLQQWLSRSPGFNLDKVTAPLLVVGEGPLSLLTMWEPYAGLRSLHKPVDLIMLNTDEHILSNPAVRVASQGGSVDWFRFWLQDYEDPDRRKTEQYNRWRELRKLQEVNDARR